MRTLTAHPPWRQLLIVSILLPVLITLAVLAFAWPTGRIQPRDVPVGIIGSSAGSQTLIQHLTVDRPGGFDLHLYADDASARSAIENRDVYGAFDVRPQGITVFVASAASPAVAKLLTGIGQRFDPSAETRDVVPLSADDPNGVVFSSALLPLTICGIIAAGAVGVLVKFRPAWRQIFALSVVSAGAGLGAYLVAQALLGALPHEHVACWATLALTMLSISAATAGLIALIGVPGLGLAAALMVFIGNPFSGATSAPELLPDAVNHLGRWLPPGAGANLLRSAAYFHGDGAGSHLTVLLVWTLLGFAAIVIGHHSPIRFAAHPVSLDEVGPDGGGPDDGAPDEARHLLAAAAHRVNGADQTGWEATDVVVGPRAADPR